jgi:hypothetical protein
MLRSPGSYAYLSAGSVTTRRILHGSKAWLAGGRSLCERAMFLRHHEVVGDCSLPVRDPRPGSPDYADRSVIGGADQRKRLILQFAVARLG